MHHLTLLCHAFTHRLEPVTVSPCVFTAFVNDAAQAVKMGQNPQNH